MPDKMTVKEKTERNIWDHLSDVLPTLKAASRGEWSWGRNGQCKYVELRIDMRSGHCIIRDRDGKRINPEDLAYQITPSAGRGEPWPACGDGDGLSPQVGDKGDGNAH